MPSPTGTIVENNLSKGFITEVTALTFPQNAFTEGENIIVNLDGSVQRRLGFKREEDGVNSTFSITSSVDEDTGAVSEFLWKAVGGDGDLNFVVIQIGHLIHYWAITNDGVLSNNRKSFTTNLNSFDLIAPDNLTCQFASGDGKLFVTHPHCEPFYVVYDATGDSITETQITVQIRDFEGVDDSLEIDERPASLSDSHEYNLYNQGWFMDDVLIDEAGNVTANPITTFQGSSVNAYPSNADIWWLFKNSKNEFDPGENAYTKAIGNTPAPKGHFILDAFDTDRSNADTDIGTVTETTAFNSRPRTTAFFAGRAWYSGVDADKYNTSVYFTQIIQRDEQIDFCYQQDDPTSESQSDLLADDGGVVKIQDAGSIIKLFPLQDKLLVMSTNGIWAIAGSQGTGFTATDFSIVKISGVSLLTADSVVEIEGLPFFWNLDGLWAVQPNDAGTLIVQSLTEKSIQSFFNSIPNQSKRYAKGAYNSKTKIVQWLFRSSLAFTVNDRYAYDRVLCLDLNLGAFYYYTFTTTYLSGIVSVINPVLTDVQTNSFYYLNIWERDDAVLHYQFDREYDDSYKDWAGIALTNYTSYFITGYKIPDLTKDFQNNFVFVYLDNDIDDEDYQASLLMQGLWDFTKTNTKRFSTSQECYRYNDGHIVTSTRKKVRGHGKSLQLKFTGSTGKPFKLLGWAAYIVSNSIP